MTKHVLILLLAFDLSNAMEGSVVGKYEPDKDLMFSLDYRTKSRVVYVQPYNIAMLNYYATNRILARIASFDGGGVRGIGPASWCANFENITQKPMADMFNLFAGTSTGGIIASGLVLENPNAVGRSRYSASDIVNLYINESENIFRPRSWLGYLFSSKYKTEPAYLTYEKYFGRTKLSEIRSDCDLLVPYYNLTNNRPAFFKSHKAKDPSFSRNGDFYLKDVLASTTAAPTYFKEFKLYTAYNKDRLTAYSDNFISAIDGGVVANDPSICALTEAMSLYRNADAFLMVSMGTGYCVSESNPKGLIGWAKNISSILMENNYEMSDYMLKKFGMYSNKPVFLSRLQFDISASHSSMDDKTPENISYLEHQAQSAHTVLNRIEGMSAMLKVTKKPARRLLTENVDISNSNFIEI